MGLFIGRVQVIADLRAVVVDYQNVHLTGHDLFEAAGLVRRHETLIDPLHFANQLLRVRNQRQQPGMPHAALHRVLVYRGEPSPVQDPRQYDRNQSQKAQWERDPRVEVHLRSLNYDYERDASGQRVHGPDGKWVVIDRREKGGNT